MKHVTQLMMNRRELGRAAGALGMGMAALPLLNRRSFAAGEITVLTWSGYDAPQLIKGYVDKYGGPPKFSYIGDDEETFQKVRAGFSPDLIHPGSYMIQQYVDADLVQPIDTSRISNWSSLAPAILDIPGAVINGKRYFVPSEFGNSSILYRTDKIDPSYIKENSWKIVYDDRYKGKLAWYDNADATIATAALVKGLKNLFTLDAAQLKEIRPLLVKQRDLTRFYWTDPTQLEQAIASGEVVASYAWNQSYVSLQSKGVPVGYMMPKEGIFAWGSGFVIHKDAKNLDAVYDYINSWISPKAGAWLIENYGYGSADLEAYKLVPKDRLAKLGFSNPESLIADTIFFPAVAPPIEKSYQALYNDVKAGG